MRKRIVSLLIVGVLAVALAGCGGGNKDAAATNQEGETTPATQTTQAKNNGIPEMVLNEPYEVKTPNGTYKLTIEGIRTTKDRNQFSEKEVKEVVLIDYFYENVDFEGMNGQDLYIDSYAFQVLDGEGNVLDEYPVYDENRNPKYTPPGGKCKASMTFGIPSESKTVNVTFTRGNEKVSKITLNF